MISFQFYTRNKHENQVCDFCTVFHSGLTSQLTFHHLMKNIVYFMLVIVNDAVVEDV